MRFLFLSLFLAVSSLLQAQAVDEATALAKAKAFVQERITTGAATTASRAKSSVTAKASGLTNTRIAKGSSFKRTSMPMSNLYAFNVGNDDGFVIVAADKGASIIGYADEGSIDYNNMSPALKDLLSHCDTEVKKAIDKDEEFAAAGTTVNGARKATANTTNKAVGPLMVTQWSQFEPYWNLTPTSSGSQTLTCCVATGLAQILYYLYYTQDGQESTSFSNSVSYNGTTISNRSYDWSLMLPHYLGEYTDAQGEAVAKLMRDVGYALNVTYGTDESTAYQTSVPNVASTYFGLATATSTTGYSNATALFKAIDTELNNYRPVQVCGNGHSFVCDGRAADGIYYHFNFGYGGGNGFYSTDGYLSYDASDMETVTGFRLSSSSSSVTTTTGLTVAYKSAVRTLGLRPVGTIPGMYQVSYYNTLKGYLDTAKGVLDGTTTVSDVSTLINNIGTAVQNMVKYTTPYDSNGFNTTGHSTAAANANGTAYRIQTYKQLAGKYGQIGWYFDNDDGYYEGDDPLLNVYGIADTYNGSKFRFIYDSSSNGYYIGNNSLDFYLMGLPDTGYGQDPEFCVYGYDGTATYHNTDPTTENEDEDTPVPCEVVPVSYLGDGTFAVTLRPMADGYLGNPDFFLDCWEENSSTSFLAGSYSSSSNSFKVNGGDAYGEYYGRWTLVPVYGTDSNGSTVTATTPTATFSNSSVEISKGSTATQTVTTNSNGTVTYSSSDISIASVDPTTGEVTGVSAGTATITAAIGCTTSYTSSGYAAAVATYTVTVTSTGPATPTIKFANSEFGVEVDKTATNTLTTNSDATPTYSSSNTSVATVNASTGAVTGVSKGTATITVSLPATDNYIAGTATYTVNVTNTLPTFNVETSALDLNIGETETRTATTNSNGTVTYTSSNTSVATVDSNGKVTAVGPGTATITVSVPETATYASVTSTYTITVTILAPELAEATDITNTSFTTTWDAVAGASGYELTLTGTKTTEQEVTEQVECTLPGITPLFTEDWSKISTSTNVTKASFNSTALTTSTISSYSDNSWSAVSYVYRSQSSNSMGQSTSAFPGIRLGYSSTSRGPSSSSSFNAGTLTTGTITKPTDTDNITIAVWASQNSSSSSGPGQQQSSTTGTLTITVGSNSTTVTPASAPSTFYKDNATCYFFNTTASSDFTVSLTSASAPSIIYYIGVYPGTYTSTDALSSALKSTTGTKDTTYVTTTTVTAGPVSYTTTDNSYTFTGLDNSYTYYCTAKTTNALADSNWGNTIEVNLSHYELGDVDLDGDIDINDVTALKDIILESYTKEHGTTDINTNGKTNIGDLPALIKILKNN